MKRDPRVNCPELHDLIQMVRAQTGGVTPIRQVMVHSWREAMAQPGADYYCTICLSTQLIVWRDGEVTERTLTYSDSEYDPDAEEQIAPSKLVLPS